MDSCSQPHSCLVPWSKVVLFIHPRQKSAFIHSVKDLLVKGQKSKVGLLASVRTELDPCVVRGWLSLQYGDDDCDGDGDDYDEPDGDNELKQGI